MSERVRVERRGQLGQITLTRAEALNALSLDMLLVIRDALEAWRHDPGVTAVLLTGEGRAFCAGGDVRQLREDLLANQPDAAREFFGVEYEVNACIDEYPKPVIALMRGATMGGGVGLAGHASVRLVFADSKVAMPETRIGFTPDVGGSWLLGRAPGRLGEMLALHSRVMNAAEAIEADFADWYIAPESEDALAAALDTIAGGADARATLATIASDPGEPGWAASRAQIDRDYAGATLADILRTLDRSDPAAAEDLRTLSPTALTVTLRSVREARNKTLRQALATEGRLAEWFFANCPDTLEGIRAQLVDKDKQPRWNPATLAELTPANLPPDSLWQ